MSYGSIGERTKDPADVRTYTISWASWLGTDTISSSSWTVPSGVTSVTTSNTTTTASIKISGGSNGHSYVIQNTVVTVGGQTREVSFLLFVEYQ